MSSTHAFSRPRVRPSKQGRALAAVAVATALSLTNVLLLASPSEAAVPTGWMVIGHDSYSRSGTTWGTADQGGAYVLKGTGATQNGQGTTTLAAGWTFEANLNAISASDVNVADTVSVTTGSSDTFSLMTGWVARRQADGSQYNAGLTVNQAGRATLGVTRVNGKTNTWLSGVVVPFTVKPGQAVRGELQVTGTSPVMVRARISPVDGPVSPWQVEFEDDSSSRLQDPGSIGLRNYAASASSKLIVTHDNLEVTAPDPSVVVPAPPVTPTPPPVAPTIKPRASRGTTLGSQSYPIPSGALFVDPVAGSDTNTGTESKPYKTVAQAIVKAASGATLVLRAGTYHESITSGKRVTIQNYPGEVVWFDGSVPVSDWRKSGSTWVHSGWKAEFDASMGGATTKARYVGASYPMAADPDQVFVDGAQLKQVANAAAVVPGTFAVSDADDTITIGTDPSGKALRASDLKMAFALSGGSTIQGIGVRRYATPHDVGAAVRLGSPGGALRQMVITDNAMQGVALSNINKVVDHVVVTKNGQLGVGGMELDGSVVQNSVIDGNNSENFNNEPVSGGVKVTQSRGIKLINNEIKDNLSAGAWFDASSYQIVAVNNDFTNNRSTQLELEVSAEGLVANNTMTGGVTGILIHDTSSVQIYNNKIGDYSIFGIKLSQDTRRQADPTVPEAHDKRRPIPDPTVTWITKDITISNNVIGNSNQQGGFQFYALDGETNRPADDMNITLDGNLFVKRIKKAATEPCMVAWGQGDNHTLVRYETPDEFGAKNAAWVNAQAPDSYRISQMDPYISQFAYVAKPLPQSVADQTGAPTGMAQLGTM